MDFDACRSLTAAFFAAYPVNRFLMARGKGHALTHEYHGAEAATGARRFIPALATSTLVTWMQPHYLGAMLPLALLLTRLQSLVH